MNSLISTQLSNKKIAFLLSFHQICLFEGATVGTLRYERDGTACCMNFILDFIFAVPRFVPMEILGHKSVLIQ